MRVLLLSAYAAGSHTYWRRTLLSMFPEWNWQVLELPPRHFSWRVRGNPLTWSLHERALLEQPFDLLLATSMVDLATLRGLVPSLGAIPSALYFHENQFEYPRGNHAHGLLEAQMVSLYSAMAADRLLFNSDFNRRTFLRGVEALMRRLPDKTPPTLLPGLLEKSQVLPVPVDVGDPSRIEAHWPGAVSRVGPDILRIAWVGRFEHDKGGEGLLRILRGLEEARLDYEIAVTGRQFRKSPDAFKTVSEAFAHRLVQLGFLPERHEYLALLRGADVVLSTADHEFQGLAVMEAVALGCVPILPDRQVYPEWYPAEYLYLSAPQDPDREAAEAVEHIIRVAQASTVPAPPEMSGLLPGVLREQYAHCFNCLAAGSA